MLLRRLVIVGFCLLLAAQAVRNSAVAQWSELEPNVASLFWSNHPAVEISGAMVQIGTSARERKPAPPTAVELIDRAALQEPLAPEPYLVRGVQLQLSGGTDLAKDAFLAAQLRDPRSLAARYFLAQLYVRNGDLPNGLREIAVISRLAPNGVTNVAPILAQYAANPSNWPQLRLLFRSNQELEEPILDILSSNSANAGTILALADKSHRTPGSPWFAQLLNALVRDAQYEKARTIWTAISGARLARGQSVYDPEFSDPRAPPPFNWSLTSSAIGMAERPGGGRLHVMFYGQDDGTLASQLVTLSPGTYSLSMRVSGEAEGLKDLSWSLSCANSNQKLAEASLDTFASRPLAITVPANCPAQLLALTGRASDLPQRSDVTLSNFRMGASGA
jgi:hypothetical protein